MNDADTPRHVRLQVEVVLEVAEPESLARAAAEHVEADEFMPDEERRHAVAAVGEDTAEAIAYLVDPIDLVSAVPGVELAQASWSSELIDYDPDADLWQFDDRAGGAADAADGAAEDGWEAEPADAAAADAATGRAHPS